LDDFVPHMGWFCAPAFRAALGGCDLLFGAWHDKRCHGVRLGARIGGSFMIATYAWKKGVLFTGLLLLGSGYVLAYIFFVLHSENFIVSQHNRAAIEYGEAHPASIPTVWLFGKGMPDNGRLGSGWLATGASNGVWMITKDAWIAFVAARADTDFLLTLDAVVFTTQATPRNRIEVSVNGQLLGSWERGGASMRSPIVIRVPSMLVRNGRWFVRIHADHLASLFRPVSDARENGQNVLLTSVTLEEAAYASEPRASLSSSKGSGVK
jgi:hypothetical protein